MSYFGPLCACVCEGVRCVWWWSCVYMSMCMHVYVWRTKVHLRYHFYSGAICISFGDSLSLGLVSPVRVLWLTSEPPEPLCLHLPVLGLQAYYHTLIFFVCAGINLMFAWWVSYQLSCFSRHHSHHG